MAGVICSISTNGVLSVAFDAAVNPAKLPAMIRIEYACDFVNLSTVNGDMVVLAFT